MSTDSLRRVSSSAMVGWKSATLRALRNRSALSISRNWQAHRVERFLVHVRSDRGQSLAEQQIALLRPLLVEGLADRRKPRGFRHHQAIEALAAGIEQAGEKAPAEMLEGGAQRGGGARLIGAVVEDFLDHVGDHRGEQALLAAEGAVQGPREPPARSITMSRVVPSKPCSRKAWVAASSMARRRCLPRSVRRGEASFMSGIGPRGVAVGRCAWWAVGTVRSSLQAVC